MPQITQKILPPNTSLQIDGDNLLLEDLELVGNGYSQVTLSEPTYGKLQNSRQLVEKILSDSRPVYAINTGFGKFKDVAIDPLDSQELQRNLIVSHACGLGPNLDRQTVRLILLLRANALAKGYSGVRVELVELILECLNRGIHPLIPEQGSLGASGDLAPLAHMSLVLIGLGQAEYKDQILSGQKALAAAGLKPIVLEAKEGLALINGTQVMSAIGSLVLLEAERLAKLVDVIGAMSLEAQLGSPKAFIEEMHLVRPHPGQLESASNLRLLLANSGLVESHKDCSMVQDAYSLRCMPQVHGASRQAFKHAREILQIEINSATDNPLVFTDAIVSGGNFHGQPLALVMDYVSIALAELANIAERRIERLVNPALSNGLPAFLTEHGGLNSGFMIIHYTAAALVSENKSLAHPASVDSIPTSANQEDHVSMGTIACRKARMILNNLRKVMSIELLCATQGLDFRFGHGVEGQLNCIVPNTIAGPGIMAAYNLVRQHIPHYNKDREHHHDVAVAEELIKSGSLLKCVEDAIGRLS